MCWVIELLKVHKISFILKIKFFVLVLANHLQSAVEQNQTWQVGFIGNLNFRRK